MRRLLLFDIDGTLVEGGPAKEAFHLALTSAFGTAGDIEVHDFSGKTDPQIARELLRGAGLTDAEVDEGFPVLWRTYLEELSRRLPRKPMNVLPGVVELLDAVARLSHVAVGLVTGNIVGGAELKLSSAGLDRHFRSRVDFGTGGFGSDSEARNDLPGIALERARRAWGVDFAPEQAVIIGDTPRDVECGLAHGTLTVAVTTGRFGAGALREAGAHHVVDDFTRVDQVVELLAG